MHHCLHIEEILVRIFEFVLYNIVHTRQGRSLYDKLTVLAFVKTCRTFNLPALQVLWMNLFNPVPLFLTMPDDLVHITEMEYNSSPLPTLVSD